MGVQETDPLAQLSLPPGFRFYPTDEELLVQYLCKKVAGHDFSLPIIKEIDLYKFDPWVLPSKAIFGEKEWYFFSPRDRKYPNGSRPNRVAGSGYWKATGTDKVIMTEGRKVGIKKALVFYVGKAPKGTKTNWIMHEYRISAPPRKNGSARLDDWVLCRIYKKNSSGQKPTFDDPPGGGQLKEHSHSHGSSTSSSSQFDDVLESLPEIHDRCFSLPRINSLKTFNHHHHHHQNDQKLNLQSFNSGSFDWASLAAGLNSLPEHVPQPQNHPDFNNNMNHHHMLMTSVPQFGQRDEEVESGIRAERVQNSGLIFNPNSFISNSLDPFGIRYPTQQGNFGFRQ